MIDQVELIAGYWTLAGNIESFVDGPASPLDFRSRVEAAAAAGYRGMGLQHADLKAVAARYGLSEMRSILIGHGLKYLEIEAFTDWFTEGERRRRSDRVRRDLWQVVERLGAGHLKVVGEVRGGDWPLERMAECFAALCQEAANAGARVSLEIIPFSNVRDLPTALEVVGAAGASNGGVLLDVWHLTRGGIPYEAIRSLPAQSITGVELCDASRSRQGTLLEDCLHRRKLCGEGDFDLPAFLGEVLARGYRGPFGVDIMSAEQRQRPLSEAASRSFATSMQQFAFLAGPGEA